MNMMNPCISLSESGRLPNACAANMDCPDVWVNLILKRYKMREEYKKETSTLPEL